MSKSKITTRIMREPEVERVTGLCWSTRRLMIQDGKFPCPVTISHRVRGYFEDEINAWLEEHRTKRSHDLDHYWQMPSERDSETATAHTAHDRREAMA